MGRYAALLVSLLFCSCCASAPPKTRIFDARPLEPEAWYQDVFNAVSRCADSLNRHSGLEYSDLEWYVIPAATIPGVAGLWSKPNRIYLDAEYVITEAVIKHEVAHAVLVAGSNAHADDAFKLCAGTL